LLGVVALLVLFRLALSLRDRWTPTPAPARAPDIPLAQRRDAVAPGQPLQPSPAAPATAQPRAPQKPTPLQLRFDDRPDLRPPSFQNDGQVQGDFGEMLTAVMLSFEGWKQLPSKMQGGRGIDGLFVRELRGGGGFEALCVETKTNNNAYDATSMTDVKLVADIGELYAGGRIGKQAAEELTRAVRQGPSFLRKELWRHDLSNGLTTISELGRNGEKGRAITRSCARLMSALYASLEQLDRSSVYVGRKPIDADES
jgi:hypothetical protein